jgi:hypothetical protein
MKCFDMHLRNSRVQLMQLRRGRKDVLHDSTSYR